MTSLCILCAVDLAPVELMTCRSCVSEVRHGLSQIEALFAVLPSLLGGPPAVGLGTVMGISGAEPPLPGGDALVMLGPGGECGEGDPLDPPAVAFELWTWQQDWAEIRGEAHDHQVYAQGGTLLPPERVGRSESVSRASDGHSVPGLVAWLGKRLEWAGSHHPAFDAFAADVARIALRLAAVTDTLDYAERGASCPYCGSGLLREYGDTGRRCSHTRPNWRLGLVPLPQGVEGPLRLETVVDRDLRIAAWQVDHTRCDVGGRVDDWSCRRCHRAFNESQYLLALRAALEAARASA